MHKNSKFSASCLASAQHVVGLDVGDRYTHFCELDRHGEIVAQGRLRTTPEAVRAHFASRQRLRIAFEAGAHSMWLAHLLSELAHDVVVANARELRRIHQSDRKNDRNDAQLLARLARVDPQLMNPIRHRSTQAQADLALLRGRDALVRARTLLINTVRGLVKTSGHRVPASSAEAFSHRAGAAIPAAYRPATAPLLAMITSLTVQIRDMDRAIIQLAAARYPQAKALQQVVGVGPLTALAFILTIEDHTRFARSREVGPYLGLVPRQASSGTSQPQLAITKAGNGYLRRLLVGCAQYILGPFGPDTTLRRCGERLTQRGGKNAKKRAVVAVARKLAVLLHRLWVTGEVYQPLYASTKLANAA